MRSKELRAVVAQSVELRTWNRRTRVRDSPLTKEPPCTLMGPGACKICRGSGAMSCRFPINNISGGILAKWLSTFLRIKIARSIVSWSTLGVNSQTVSKSPLRNSPDFMHNSSILVMSYKSYIHENYEVRSTQWWSITCLTNFSSIECTTYSLYCIHLHTHANIHRKNNKKMNTGYLKTYIDMCQNLIVAFFSFHDYNTSLTYSENRNWSAKSNEHMNCLLQ